MCSFLYKLKLWSVTSWRQTGMSMILKQRMEAMKEIIEADTDPMKEVLCLRATFVPTPTQKMMLSNLGQGGRPWRRSLRLTLTPWKRCYASGQHLLQLNKLCCQIWSKEGNHEGDHWGWSAKHMMLNPHLFDFSYKYNIRKVFIHHHSSSDDLNKCSKLSFSSQCDK